MTARPPLYSRNAHPSVLGANDGLQLRASTTADASMNMPHGVAPSSPVNGDVWTTTAGIFARINGVTIGPLVNAAGDTMTGTLTLAGDPGAALQAATKQYVDNLVAGLSWKQACVVATTANITLSGEQTIDGVTTSASRVLVKNQSTASQNGIYVSAAGSWARAGDMDAGAEFPGASVFIERGTVAADTQWVCTNASNPTVGSTSITFAQFATGGATGANPTATVSGSAVNGVAATFMRSDAAPALANTAVTPGAYTNLNATIDAQGRIIAAANGTGGGGGYINPCAVGVPQISSWSTLQGSHLTTAQGSVTSGVTTAISLSVPYSYNGLVGLYATVPTAPYRIAIRLLETTPNTANTSGVGYYDPISGKVTFIGMIGNAHILWKANFSASTTFASYSQVGDSGSNDYWYGLRNDGTNIIYEISRDGVIFEPLFSETIAGGYLAGAYGNAGAFISSGAAAPTAQATTFHAVLQCWDVNGLTRTLTQVYG